MNELPVTGAGTKRRGRKAARSSYPSRHRRRLAGSTLVAGLMVCWVALAAAPASAVTSTAPASALRAAAPAATGWLRFGHFAPSEGAVNVTLDGTTFGRDLTFRNVTAYTMVAAGAHTVTVVSATGASTPPILVGKVTVPSGGAMTVGAVAASTAGDKPVGVALQTYSDDLAAPAPGYAKVRVIHTVPGVPQVTTDLTAATTGAPPPLAISAVGYGQASPYASVRAGTYQVAVKAPNGATLVAGQNWPVAAGTVTSIVVVDASSGPTLEVLADAAGAASVPQGGMQTGLGGTAPRPSSFIRSAWAPATMVILLMAAAALAGIRPWRKRRSAAGVGRHPGSNTLPAPVGTNLRSVDLP